MPALGQIRFQEQVILEGVTQEERSDLGPRELCAAR